MKTEKLSLKSIKNVLSRAEMKKIMAGSSGDCQLGLCNDDGSSYSCAAGCQCAEFISGQPQEGYWCI
jgi:hypothetical protein